MDRKGFFGRIAAAIAAPVAAPFVKAAPPPFTPQMLKTMSFVGRYGSTTGRMKFSNGSSIKYILPDVKTLRGQRADILIRADYSALERRILERVRP